MGRLEVRVCAARNIADTQKVGIPDPYVRVRMGTDKKTMIKFKTRVIDNQLNPEWNELFKFQIADYDTTQIVFEVWNDNVMVDDLLGTYSLSVNGLERGVVRDAWVILSGAKVSTAELHLRVLAVDFGKPPAPGTKPVASIEEDGYQVPSDQATKPGTNPSPPAPPIQPTSTVPLPLVAQGQGQTQPPTQTPQYVQQVQQPQPQVVYVQSQQPQVVYQPMVAQPQMVYPQQYPQYPQPQMMFPGPPQPQQPSQPQYYPPQQQPQYYQPQQPQYYQPQPQQWL